MCELCREDNYVPFSQVDMPSVETPGDEERRERDWFALEVDARDFVKRYGAAAMLRCVSRALEG